ncbi:MAG: hypothetical protein JWN24_271 [Phycisphaerales bacterium]|jgi:hypothetical protein|nr:hypothetical protein [Phycisphaerales bacterium]
MIDSTTHAPIIVSTESNAGPYIVLPFDQLEPVTSVLRNNQIPFWVDSLAISVNGKRELTVVNFGRGVNAAQVQRLLDAA